MTNDDVAELLLELGEELRTLGQRFHDEADAYSTHKVLEAYNLGMWRGLSQARLRLEKRAVELTPPPPGDE